MIKEIRILLDEKEYGILLKDKKDLTWKQFLMRIDLKKRTDSYEQAIDSDTIDKYHDKRGR